VPRAACAEFRYAVANYEPTDDPLQVKLVSLSEQELKAHLNESLDPVLSAHRPVTSIARALAALQRDQQDFVLKWIDIIVKTNADLAYQFAARAPEAFGLMSALDMEAWIIQAMDVYDKQGLYPGCAAFDRIQLFAMEAAQSGRGVRLDDIQHRLELFVRGLSGRALKVEAAADPGTDTATLYLPERLTGLATRQDNFLLYKAMTAHLWAQTWYGTFRHRPGTPTAREALSAYSDSAKAQKIFHALETVRLNARIHHGLPGLYRDMLTVQHLHGAVDYPEAWSAALKRLGQPDATASDSLAWVPTLIAGNLPAAYCYQGNLLLERAEHVRQERLAREQEQIRDALLQLDRDSVTNPDDINPVTQPRARRYSVQKTPDPEQPGQFTFQLFRDGHLVEPPTHIRTLMNSIVQDLGGIPDHYLVAEEPVGPSPADNEPRQNDRIDVVQNEAIFLYDEWDHRRNHYRKDWCTLHEIDVDPLDEPFVSQTLAKYRGILSQLRKTFEALRGENRLLKKQLNGDEIDFDALVEAYADMRGGMELSERLFTKIKKVERDIAVLFMVDMSGSTKGWINDAERESLVLLCEALEILGDRYAIYGFSGMTRKRCVLYRIKRFEEHYADDVRQRIAGIQPQDYTRMGVTIRHLTRVLQNVEARTKLLITLSDGKPDDFDGYRGEYGIEDTRMSLIEAKRAGIHPFCITIDEAARDYLPHMYGAVNWTLVDNVRRLPVKVSEIYRRLTL